ncbi:MAG: hypothetical protein KDD22_01740 [Bdellovibrionales bacterium]|nr:hypothetical protein [Bdellovibrionales bacterium]
MSFRISMFSLLFTIFFVAPMAQSQMTERIEIESEKSRSILVDLGLGYEARMSPAISEKSDYSVQQFPNLFLAFRTYHFETVSEIADIKSSTEEGDYSIENQRREFRQWFRYVFRSPSFWGPYLGAGIGAHQNTLRTQWQSDVRQSLSPWEPNYGIELGGKGPLFGPFVGEIDFRGLKDSLKSNTPWEWGVHLQFGIRI